MKVQMSACCCEPFQKNLPVLGIESWSDSNDEIIRIQRLSPLSVPTMRLALFSLGPIIRNPLLLSLRCYE